MRRWWLALVPALVFQVGASEESAETQARSLMKLPCLEIVVEKMGEEAASLVSEQELEDATLVTLKQKLPNLKVGKVGEECWAYLYVRLTLMLPKADNGRPLFSASHLECSLKRRARIEGLTDLNVVGVWDIGTLLLAAPPSDARKQVLGALDHFLTSFSADYIRAGNK